MRECERDCKIEPSGRSREESAVLHVGIHTEGHGRGIILDLQSRRVGTKKRFRSRSKRERGRCPISHRFASGESLRPICAGCRSELPAAGSSHCFDVLRAFQTFVEACDVKSVLARDGSVGGCSLQ